MLKTIKYYLLVACLVVELNSFAADRYFVYSDGVWGTVDNWSDVSGGVGGFSIPTSADNVFFDANSFSGPGQSVQIYGASAECYNMDWTGAMNSPAFQGASFDDLYIYGNLIINNGVNDTDFQATIYFASTTPGNTITSGGLYFNCPIHFSGAGGGWTLLDNLRTTSDVYVDYGSFNTGSFNVACNSFFSNNANVRNINLGSSTMYLHGNAEWNMNVTTNLTFSSGTSLINFMSSQKSCIFRGGNLTYYNFFANDLSLLLIYGSNTFREFYARNFAVGEIRFEINRTQTIIDSLLLFGSPPNKRLKIRSTATGTQSTFSKATGKVCCNYLDIAYNNASGGAAYFAGANSINSGNNSGWTFSTCPPPMTISVSKTDVTCSSACTGTATVTVTPGTPPYSYNWSTGGTASTISGLCPGTYTVTVIDWVPDTLTASVTITEPNALSASISTFSNITCNGQCDGTETVSVSGGTPNYTYLWSNGQTNSTATGLCASVAFTVTVTDSKGCTATATRTLTQPAVLNASISSSSNATCFGACDGQATATAGGGTPGYTYVWDDPPPAQSVATAVGLCAGTYNVLVTDLNGCQDAATVTITQPTQITINISSSTNVSCFGLCNGTATSSAAGGSPSYTYSWSNGENTPSATGLCAGVNTITVTDSKGCTATDNVTITEPPQLSASVSTVFNVTCFGSCNGSATVNPSGGTPGYTYAWSGGGCTTCQTNTILCAITYTITVTDNKGCTTTTNASLTQPTPLTADIVNSTNANCFGSCSGMAVVVAGGGTVPYTYQWDDPLLQTNDTATGLCADFYTVTVTDANGCDTLDTISIIEPQVIAIATDVSCSGFCDGLATASPSGGTPPYIFQWYDSIPWAPIPGETDTFMDSLCTGTYCLITTDNNGCPDTTCVTIALPSITTSDTLPSCPGDCDGKIVVIAIGGNPPYTYEWRDILNNVIDNDSILAPVCAGKYYIYITNSIGCLLVDSVNLFDPSWLTASVTSQTNVSCNSQCNGSVTVTPSGGVSPYTYAWSNGDTGPTGDSLCAGTRTVTITDSKGCDTVITVTITQPPVLTVNPVAVNNVTCGGACNGSITVTGSGGTPAYSYLWSGGQVTGSLGSLCPGSYTVTVTDSKGCTATGTFTITEPSVLTLNTSKTDLSCFGNCMGTATVTVSGGVLTYSYVWSDPLFQSTSTATGLCAQAYTVTVTDGNLCTQTASVTLTQPSQLTASITNSVNPQCGGQCTGLATVTPGGGSPAYSYLWSNGQIAALAINLCAGTYTVTVTDSKGCTATASVTITTPPTLVATISDSTATTCFGDCDGDATVSASGGAPPYTVLWNAGGQTTSTATGLCAGTYFVTVTDANNCTDVEDVIIIQPAALAAVISAPDASCGGVCDVTATATPSGGTPPYTFQWNDPGNQTGNPATGLCAGTFSVTITDSKGCTVSYSFNVNEPAVLTLDTVSTTTVGCFGDCSGQAEVAASGGTPAYTYQWNNGDAGPIADSLCSQVYVATVTDANGCTATTTVPITGPGGLSASIENFTNTTCYNVCDGAAEVAPVGGSPPYTIQWTDSAGLPVGTDDTLLTVLCDGEYVARVTDNNGCFTISDTVFITEPPLFIVSGITSNDASCNAICNGDATAAVTGGTPPLTYSWSNGDAVLFTDSLCAGAATITVTDASGCTATGNVTITQPTAISITITPFDAECNGVCDGQATASASGGIPSYTYSWSNGDAGPLSDTLCAGALTVTVTDGNGCTVTQTTTIGEPSTLQLSFVDTTSSTCGACNGDATVSASGGTPPYTFAWSTGGSDAGVNISTETGLCISTYRVTLTDANGCTDQMNVVVSGPGNLTSTISDTTHESCSGMCDGSAEVTASGGTTPYSYAWLDAGSNIISTGFDTIMNRCPGTYTAQITDFTGCIATVSVSINAAPLLTFSDTTVSDISCNGLCDGSVSVAPSGGTPPYTYSWAPGGQTSSAISGLCAGNYSLTMTDANGCIAAIAGIAVTEPAALAVTVTSNNPTCTGLCDGDATAAVTGGTPPYTYLWSGSETVSTIGPLCAGTFTLTVTDANGCTATGTAAISDPGPVVIDSVTVIAPSCNGLCDGTATVFASGGSGSYTYVWSSGGTSQTETGLCDGTYTVTVTDNNGCGNVTGTATLAEPAPIGINITSVNVACGGTCTGQATVNAGGGTPPYSLLWSAGAQTTQTLTGLCAGAYSVTVTDDNGCTGTQARTINENAPLVINLLTNNPASCTVCDGIVQVVATGGVPPYSYQWDDPDSQTTETATGLCVSSYNVTATDDSACTDVLTVTLTGPNGLTSTITDTTFVSCYGVCNGSAESEVTGGTTPYTHQWYDLGTGLAIPGETDTLITGLCLGDYTDTITDGSGCKTIALVTITGPAQFVAVISDSTDVACGGSCNGSATVSATGGVLPYTFLWSTGDTDTTISGLCAGTYCVTVTSSNGCGTVSACVTIDQPQVMTLSMSINSTIICYGYCTGEVEAYVTGGLLPYTYQWNPAAGSTSDTLIDTLCAGTYYLTVTDGNGCTVNDSSVITQPALFAVAITDSTMITCNGMNNGEATATVTGVTTPFTFLWDNGDADTLADSLSGGPHCITVTDAGGCTTSDCITIVDPAPLIVTITNFTNVTCNGLPSGSATASATGGTPPYTLTWNVAGETDSLIDTLYAGSYCITVTDQNGCMDSACIALTDSTNMAVSVVSVTGISCKGRCTGNAVVQGTGSAPPYAYQWSNNDTDTLADSLCAGTFDVTVTSDSGCVRFAQVTITQPDSTFSFAFTGVVNSPCATQCTGQAAVFASGGNLPYTYSWSTADSTASADTLCPGTYYITVTDSNTCILPDSVIINGNALIYVNDDTTSATCNNISNGAIDISVSGGVSPYTYLWSTSDTTEDLINILPGIYYVTITDTLGCYTLDTFTVTSLVSLAVSPSEDTVVCENRPLVLTGSSVPGGAAYSWYLMPDFSTVITTDTFISITASDTASYLFIATLTGCTDSDTVIVTPLTAPVTTATTTDSSIMQGQVTDLIATGGGIYDWSPGTGLSDSTAANPEANPIVTTTYIVIVTATSGCTATDSVTIYVSDKIFIPNGISPNGDGKNDVWEIPLLDYYPDVSVEIFNRWGEQVFESPRGDKYTTKFTGTYKGKPLPAGTYYFIINFGEDSMKPVTGPVTIMK